MNKFFRKKKYSIDSAPLQETYRHEIEGERRGERQRSRSQSESDYCENSQVSGGGGFDNYAYDEVFEDVVEAERTV